LNQPSASKVNKFGQKLFGGEYLVPASELPKRMFEFQQDVDSDDDSEKSLLQGREMPSQFDKENNYYMLYWKTYLDNE